MLANCEQDKRVAMGSSVWKMHDMAAGGAKNLRKGKLREGEPNGDRKGTARWTGTSDRRKRVTRQSRRRERRVHTDRKMVDTQVQSGRPQGPELHPRSQGTGQPDRALRENWCR